jgi:hypothetical protein
LTLIFQSETNKSRTKTETQNTPQKDGKTKCSTVRSKKSKQTTLHFKMTKSQKNTKEILNICGNHTYLTKIEEKTIWRVDSRPKITLNHSSSID